MTTSGGRCVVGLVLIAAASGIGCGSDLVEDLQEVAQRARRDHGRHPPPPAQAAAPRLMAPLSGSWLSTNRPRLTWELPAAADGGLVEVCGDPTCQRPLASFTATGTSAATPQALPAGAVFWRVRASTGGQAISPPSATWELFLPHRTATPSAVLATRADVDGDGRCDFLLDARVLRGGPGGYSTTIALPAAAPDAAAVAFTFAGDLDGNGLGDVLRVDASTAASTMGIWTPVPLLASLTGFRAGAANVTSLGEGAIFDLGPAGDVNGDGYADVLFKSRFGLVTYYGTAGGIRDGSTPATETTQAFFGFGGDVDGDGFTDAASASNGDTAIEVTRGTAGGFDRASFRTIPLAMAPRTGLLAMVDANNDGYADLAITLGDSSLALFAGGPAGLAGQPFQVLPAPPCNVATTCQVLAAAGSGDFNGDGWSDLITSDGQTTEVHYGRAAGGVDPVAHAIAIPAGANIQLSAGAIGDVDGDGFDDLTATIFQQDPQTQRSRAVSAVLVRGSAAGLTAPLPPATP